MYKIINYPGTNNIYQIILNDYLFVPFDKANTDYQKFKFHVLAGSELQDANGNVMTQEEAIAFIKTLP